MNIGTALQKLRRQRKVQQETLAALSGYTQSYISMVERGHKVPSMEFMESMGKHLQVPIQVLMWYSLDEGDVQKEKRPAFKVVKPIMDNLINELI